MSELAFKNVLYNAMNKKHMNQPELARAIGMNQGCISKYLSGHVFPTRETLEKLEDVLGEPFTVYADAHAEEVKLKYQAPIMDNRVKPAPAPAPMSKLSEVIVTVYNGDMCNYKVATNADYIDMLDFSGRVKICDLGKLIEELTWLKDNTKTA